MISKGEIIEKIMVKKINSDIKSDEYPINDLHNAKKAMTKKKSSNGELEKRKKNLANILSEQLYLLIDDIREIVPSDKQGMWMIVKNFFCLLDKETVVQHIIAQVLPYKDEILERNEDFFMKNTKIFNDLPESEVNYFKTIIGKEGKIDQQDKDKIWKYFEIFVVIAEEYKKKI